MAKKKQAAAVSNGGAATRSRSKKTAAASEAAASGKGGNNKAPARKTAQQGTSTQLIGETAGRVWQALSDDGPQTIAALKKAVGTTDDLVLFAIGWLAREDKLEFETSGRSTTVSLRE